MKIACAWKIIDPEEVKKLFQSSKTPRSLRSFYHVQSSLHYLTEVPFLLEKLCIGIETVPEVKQEIFVEIGPND